MTVPTHDPTKKLSLPAALMLGLGGLSLICGCFMILLLIWGQSTPPRMYADSEGVTIHLVCFTSPFLAIAAALLAGGYYAHRWAGVQGKRIPMADLPSGQPLSASHTSGFQTQARSVEPPSKKIIENRPKSVAESSLGATGSPAATPLEAKIRTYQSEGNAQALLGILKSPETDDKTAELIIEALSDLGLPAMEALCDALGDRSRLTRILSLQEQGANVGPLLRTAISSAARFYRLKR